jgi:hypothetical protein
MIALLAVMEKPGEKGNQAGRIGLKASTIMSGHGGKNI